MRPAAGDGTVTGGPARRQALRAVPIARFLLYYAILIAVGAAIIMFVPGARQALIAPIVPPAVGQFGDLFTGGAPAAGAPGAAAPASPWSGTAGRGLLTMAAVLGALALALPVAWVHVHTRRFRYDPSLVHAIIVLPIVVAGVVLVVKNSLALAFALAGIVAGVRFRQKLNEPQEAVYVLLSLGIGLAAGVQALDVALVMSLIFNLVVLASWRYDIDAALSGGPVLLVTGDTSVLPAPASAERRDVEVRAAAHADGMAPHGILVVHARDAGAAMPGIDAAVGQVAKEWRFTEPVIDAAGHARFEVLVRFTKNGDPMELLAELDARCSREIVAAEYIPYRGTEEAEA
jgi:hypothetical protein